MYCYFRHMDVCDVFRGRMRCVSWTYAIRSVDVCDTFRGRMRYVPWTYAIRPYHFTFYYPPLATELLPLTGLLKEYV